MFIWRNSCFKRSARDPELDPARHPPALHDGIAKIHHRHDEDSAPETTTALHSPIQFPDNKRKAGSYHVFKRDPSARPLFNWADYPSLVTDAFENGWSLFGFTSPPLSTSAPSLARSSSIILLLGRLCTCREKEVNSSAAAEPEISWEVSQSSADFMQKIRLNPGGQKRRILGADINVPAVIRTALPLPGPSLGNNANSAFPQEAYFEITISYSGSGEDRYQNGRRSSSAGKGEKIKLIQELVTDNPNSNMEELKDENKKSEVMSSVVIGLSVGSGCSPFKIPGSYQGSIGFNSSNGSVYLDGLELGIESKALDWRKTRERVIGCGFDPRQKKVVFTVDSELVHTIHCKSDEFGTPLYPTVSANGEVLLLVNLGQSAFSYDPANAHRTPNPCFIRPLVNSAAALGYDEDSKELFSMGKIDSQWLNRSATKYPRINIKETDEGEESEAELFEIVLESIIMSGPSPETPTTVL